MIKFIYITIIITPILYFLYLVIVYTFTHVPYVKTPKKYLNFIINNIEINSRSRVVDLGCGNGTFLFAAEKKDPRALIGYDLSFIHILYARAKAVLKKSKAKFFYKNFFNIDLSRPKTRY